ncbi:Uncharacterised protein [Mycobacteroides abscessus subsp. abscessus]|nr:Uncharacterised protein [Mycobacteroides abscessus subsp. abscessus]
MKKIAGNRENSTIFFTLGATPGVGVANGPEEVAVIS